MLTAFQHPNATLKRGVGLLLLIFIFYGTTVEAAHRHGRVTPAANHAAAFAQTGSKSTTQTSQPGCNDCLICQLHQNFSATLISVGPDAAPVVGHTHTPQLIQLSIGSIANNPQTGRAPPKAN